MQRDNQAACPGCKYRVDGLYLWNSASWDITGIYPESSSQSVGSRPIWLPAPLDYPIFLALSPPPSSFLASSP